MSLGTEFVELNKSIHDRDSFDCGENELNRFLKKQALKHMQVGVSKTMILSDQTSQENNKFKICAFFTIAPSSIKKESLPTKLAKKLPHYPVPVFLLAQMGVHIDHQGKGFGKQALEFIEDYARKNNFNVLYLAANIKEKAFKIYEKYGFKKTNWFFMEKELK